MPRSILWHVTLLEFLLPVQVLCALVASSDDKQQWLYSAGILPLLHRLTLGRSLGLDEVPPAKKTPCSYVGVQSMLNRVCKGYH